MNKYASLTPEVLRILQAKATESPFSGKYYDSLASGTYLCRGCGLALFRGNNQFHSGCGWPSFDQEIPGAVLRKPDKDGRRIEILCRGCNGHLGHVFTGEGFTSANTRHCVNSLAIEFVNDKAVLNSEEIILAAGCFWGVEHLFKPVKGILLTEVGYSGGLLSYPSYEAVCSKNTGHLEAVRIVFDPKQITLSDLLGYFFEIHNFTQINGQGPDIGPQYLSAIFYFTEPQQHTAKQKIEQLITQGYKVATRLYPAMTFWPAEDYHQAYYQKNGQTPYCHIRKPLIW
ncbi:MAG: msrA3 [Gammaproteobacteria bacterium]|jgi:peptide methionine sulfoxide reductase msrA/msrB|nr:msrA3 [Gammaproteobacteria bacterium]